MSTPGTALVGRRTELAHLLELIDTARNRSTGVLLTGDAGVGKTRLLQEVIQRRRADGWQILVGRCLDFGDAGLAYLPISEAFGRLVVEEPNLVSSLVEQFPTLSRLLPATRRLVAQAQTYDERVERGALFDGVQGALDALSARAPTLLIVEDVHWADQATRDLLGFLLARLASGHGVAVVVSYRSEDLHRLHPLRKAAAEWARLSGVSRLELPPLTGADIRTLVAQLSSQPLAERTIRAIVERSGGNAFYAEQLQAAPDVDEPTSLPAQLADLLLVRLDQLGSDARLALRAAAVAGRQVSHELLAGVLDIDAVGLDAALREAVEQHLLEPTGGTGYEFRHALLAEAVYADLLPGERVRLHARYFQVLTTAGSASAAELARHARESHDLAAAFTASVRAGDEAMTVAAAEDAMRHFESALELAAHAPPATSNPASSVAAKAAEAASVAGHAFRALALARQSLADLPAGADPLVRASVLLDVARYAIPVDSETDIQRTTAAALRLVPAGVADSLRARIAAIHARHLRSMGLDLEARRWAQEAIQLATVAGDTDTADEARTTAAVLDQRAGDPTTAIKTLLELREQARSRGELASELRSGYTLGNLYLEGGDLLHAVAAYEGAAQRARAGGRPWAVFGIESRVLATLTRYYLGDWDASLAHCSVGGQAPPPLGEAMLVAARLAVLAGRGELSALVLLPHLAEWRPRESMVAVQMLAAADLYAYAGEPNKALELLDTIAAELVELWQQPLLPAQIRLSGLALGILSDSVAGLSQTDRRAAVERGERYVAAAKAVVTDNEQSARHVGVEALAWDCRLDAEWNRLRWLAGIDAPSLETNIAGWQAALTAFDYGDQYEQARCRSRLATVLSAAGQSAEAAEQVERATVTARALGAVPLLKALGTLRPGKSAEASSSTAATRPGLTAREIEVLGLLELGRTNRQIAQQLYISEKTVSVHVSNILAKLGAHSRTEAAAIGRRDGLS
jgi:DNA-binding CsgD family transcriptional regulator/tetratricopeptide (TPR) repeat protein